MDTTACDLFRRCLTRRHPDDWHEFIGRYQQRVHGLARQVLVRQGVRRAAQETDEYVQELYLRLWSVDGLCFRGRTEEDLWQYFARAVHNLAVDHRRRAKAARRCRERLRLRGQEAMSDDVTVSPERRAMARQDLRGVIRRVRRAARNIRVELKLRVIRLAYLDGCSSPEITLRLRGLLTPAQVDATLCRLRRRLSEDGLALGRRYERAPAPG
jgi:RNA polymerase sigma factor (sigma-70 family)